MAVTNTGRGIEYLQAQSEHGARQAMMDFRTGLLVTEDHITYAIHAGSVYRLGINALKIKDTPLRIRMDTPTGLRVHAIGRGSASGMSVFRLIESPTSGATGGTVVVPVNRCRSSERTAYTICTVGVSEPIGGTVLQEEWHGIDKDRIASRTRDEDYWVLDLGATYVFEMTSTEDSVGDLFVTFGEFLYKD